MTNEEIIKFLQSKQIPQCGDKEYTADCQADKEHRYSDYRPFWCPLVKISNEYIEADRAESEVKNAT